MPERDPKAAECGRTGSNGGGHKLTPEAFQVRHLHYRRPFAQLSLVFACFNCLSALIPSFLTGSSRRPATESARTSVSGILSTQASGTGTT